jgi:hypothetical protein
MNANAVEHETQRIAASKALDMVQQRLQTYLGRGDERLCATQKVIAFSESWRRFRDIVTCEQSEMSTKYVF